jgi:FKBP-type peptidyl-prolyl cis-trans isomerase 2
MTLLPGESRTFEIAAEDAYGARDDEKLQKFPVSEEELASLRESVTPGQVVQLPNGGAALPLPLRRPPRCAHATHGM